MYYIGIDLGTSAVKLLLVDENGGICNEVTREYPLEFPQPGWSQQAPEDWKKAVLEGIPALLSGFDAGQVAGIGCGGQMHGLVVLDDRDQVIRPAILWNDGRTAAEVDYLNGEVGKEKLSSLTANIAFAGFTVPVLPIGTADAQRYHMDAVLLRHPGGQISTGVGKQGDLARGHRTSSPSVDRAHAPDI